MINNFSIVLLYGLGQTWLALNRVETFLSEYNIDVHKIDYPSRTERLQECVEIVVDELRNSETLNDNIIVIGQSAGGLIGSRLHLYDLGNKEIVNLITIGSPLQGARRIIEIRSWIPSKIEQFLWNIKMLKPIYYDLIELSSGIQDVIIPTHDYHCIMMSWPFSDSDRAVYKDEAIFQDIDIEEERTTHFDWTDHDTVFMRYSFYEKLAVLLNLQ